MPPELPVDHLSLSSINRLRKCSESWRRRYVEREYEPSNGPMTIGKAAGAAEAQSDHTWMESSAPLDSEQVLDAYSDEFDLAAAEDVDWKGEKPEKLKDSGAGALRSYHRDVRPISAAPVEAEREARLDIEGVEFVAYLDVETKVTKQRWSQEKADEDPQATAYLAVRRAEGNPASGFAFDAMVRVKQPYSERVPTERTDEQLDHFLLDVLGAADEIEWRMQTDHWSYAPPGAWWCSESMCGYWSACPGGGLLRKRAAEAVLAA
jgi:hypothetical protein